MTKVNFILISLLLAVSGYGQKFKPSTQSNPSLEFTRFLSGVRYAYVLYDNNFEQYITRFPGSENANAASGLENYLRDIGFEDVRSGSFASGPHSYVSLCEMVTVTTTWQYQDNTFSNIILNFRSCNGDIFTFTSKEKIKNDLNNDVSQAFSNAYLQMYGYKKLPFISSERLTLPHEMTEWTQESLRAHILTTNASDPIEGIYETYNEAASSPKYVLGVAKSADGYKLIYFSGALNSSDWTPGELKGRLYPTASQGLYKVDWLMMNKTIDKTSMVSFVPGMMNLESPGGKTDVYVKTFPASPEDDEEDTYDGPGQGTGFAIASNGLIITNHHVIQGAKSIKVRGVNGDYKNFYMAQVVVDDQKNDLAIIKITDNLFFTLGNIPYSIDDKVSDVGSAVYVMGYPLLNTMGDEIKLTNGIISSKSGYQGDVTCYQISAPVQPGNSGGPLFNDSGNVIGIVNAKHDGAENVTYAIKASYLESLLKTLHSPPDLGSQNTLAGKSLPEQVKTVEKYIYIIETE